MSGNHTITFSEYPLGTVNPTYTFTDNKVSVIAEVVSDGAQPNSPAAAANTSYSGPVYVTFANPVTHVDFVAGYFNDLGSTTINFLGVGGTVLRTETNNAYGVLPYSYDNAAGITGFQVIDSATDAAGFSVDTVTFSGSATPVTPIGTVSIAAASATKAEGNSGTTPFTFTVTRSGNVTAAASVGWALTGSGSQPINANDLPNGIFPRGSVSFAAGETSKTITVNIAGDTRVETDETFAVTLFAPSAGLALGTASATGTVLEDDSLARLSIMAASASKTEGNSGTTPFTFTVTRSGNTNSAVSAVWSVTGTGGAPATAGDFTGATLPGGTVTFAAGETSKTVTVNVAGDMGYEPDETFRVTLSNPVGATISTTSATGTIRNDDVRPVATVSAASVMEGNGGTSSLVFTVALSVASPTATTFSYTTLSGTALAGSDYTGTAGTLTIAAGAMTGTIVVPVIGDMRYEADETLSLRLYNANGATFSGGASSITATGTIRNDDAKPVATLSAASVTEGNGGTTSLVFTVALSAASGTATTFSYATANGTAVAGADYIGRTGTLTIAAGATMGTIVVPVIGERTVEPDETLTLTLSNPVGAVFNRGSASISATGTIRNDDANSHTITFSEYPLGTVNPTYTFTDNKVSVIAEVVPDGAQPNSPAAAANRSYSGPVYVTFANPVTHVDFVAGYFDNLGNTTINFLGVGGTVLRTETNNAYGVLPYSYDNAAGITGFQVIDSATDAAGFSVDTVTFSGSATPVTPIGTVSIAAASATKAEGNSGTTPFTFTVTRSGNVTAAASVGWALTGSGSQPINANDLPNGIFPRGSVSFAAGETSKTITVNIAGDTRVETDETFAVTLFAPSAGLALGTASATGTVLEDDSLARLSIMAASASKTEGNSGTTPFTFTVTRSGNTNSAVSAVWSVTGTGGAPATAGDFTGATLPGGTVTFAAGETSKTVTVNVAGDMGYEPDETFRVTLSNPVGATISTTSATGTIRNDDVRPVATVSAASVMEGNGGTSSLVFTVALSVASPTATTFSYTTLSGTALAGSDYTGTAGTLTIAAGAMTGTIVVPVIGDMRYEADETLSLRLYNANGATFSGGASSITATGTIRNDDAKPVATLSAASVTEGNGGTTSLVFTVALSAASGTATTFSYATANGTAVAGVDYFGRAGTLTIAAGATMGTIVVPVIGERTVEPDETLTLTLSNPVGAVFNRGSASISATGTIRNDDAKPVATVSAASVTEGNGGTTSLVFTVALSAASATATTFSYATANGTAVAGVDYFGRAGTLTIAAGATMGMIVVPVIGERTLEPDETLTLTLSNPVGATFSGGAVSVTAMGTIRNDDARPVATVSAASVMEGNGGTTSLVFRVALSAASATATTLSYTTVNGTAVAGTDYIGKTGTLTIAAGATTGTIIVPVIGDTRFEADETLSLRLSDAIGATFSGGASSITATGTIRNDDAKPVATLSAASVMEGNSGTTSLVFRVALSAASETATTFFYATSSGTASAASDYVAKSGTLTIAAGATTGTIVVSVIGDTRYEADETLSFSLYNAVGASFAGGRSSISATGTIRNDDPFPKPTAVGIDTTISVRNTRFLSSLYTVKATPGDIITGYQVLDTNAAAASGTLSVGGAVAAAGTPMTLTTGQFATATFKAGAAGATDTLFLRVANADGYGSWAPVNVKTVALAAPVVAVSDRSVSANASVALSALFTATSPDGASITNIQVLDMNAEASSGSITLGGVAQNAGAVVDVLTSQLASATFRAGLSGASDELWVRASNGTNWSNWGRLTVTSGLLAA